MSKCINCGHAYNCECQKKVASDNVLVCSECIDQYEQDLKTKQNNDTNTTTVSSQPLS
jgi:hypothetical protein